MANRPQVTVSNSASLGGLPTILRAPSQTRTDTERILSPLPLPIGLWGRRSGSGAAGSARSGPATDHRRTPAAEVAPAVLRERARRRRIPWPQRPRLGVDHGIAGAYAWAEIFTREPEKSDAFFPAVFSYRSKRMDDPDNPHMDFRVFDLGQNPLLGRMLALEGCLSGNKPADAPGRNLRRHRLRRTHSARHPGSLHPADEDRPRPEDRRYGSRQNGSSRSQIRPASPHHRCSVSPGYPA